MTRELSLFNPLGIERETGVSWVGQADDQPDSVFVKFIDFPHGIRAGVEILKNYVKLHGITTVAAATSRWAPPTENNTVAYIDDICTRCSCQPDTPFMTILPKYLRGICDHENGVAEAEIVTDADITAGIALA